MLIHVKGVYNSDSREINGTGLLIRNGLIQKIGEYKELAKHYSDEILDYSDEYVFPGLINTHVHLELTPGASAYDVYVQENNETHWKKALEHAKQMLKSGVTTVRDMGSSMYMVNCLKQLSQEEKDYLPSIQISGMPLTEKNGHMHFLGEGADTEEELCQKVRELKKAGCNCIKIIANGGQNTPGSKPEYDAYDEKKIRIIVEEAHKAGLTTAVHCLTTRSFVKSMRAGVDSIEHAACFVRRENDSLLERVYIPEIMEEFRGDHRWFMIGFSNDYHKLDKARANIKTASEKELFWLEQEKKEADIFKCILDLGLKPVIGTDGGCGFTYFDETWLEVALLSERCGLSAEDAIHAATVNGAAALGLENQTGQIKEGLAADLIFMKENPLKNIRALGKVAHVIRNGILI